MPKVTKSKSLQIMGALLILLCPIWLYVSPAFISPLFCDPNNKVLNPAIYGGTDPYPCADDTLIITTVLIISSLVIGGVFIYLAGNAKQKSS